MGEVWQDRWDETGRKGNHDFRSEGQEVRKSAPPSKVLWVGNLPARRSVNEQDIRDIFAQLGVEVKDVRFGMPSRVDL